MNGVIKAINFTLYEFFGYLLPGSIALTALLVFGWSLFLPRKPLLLAAWPTPVWIAFILGSYFAGHLAQAVANIIAKRATSPEALVLEAGRPDPIPRVLIEAARGKAEKVLGISLHEMEPRWLYRVCDEILIRAKSPGNREIYVYREGFYRGLSVACGLLCVSLSARLFVTPAIAVGGSTVTLTRGIVAFLVALSGAGALLAFQRYLRFGQYRVADAVIGVIAWQASKGSHPELPKPEESDSA